ncbi:MAG: protoheme IX farnesyltransferase [Bacillaceae bacterium]|nr:protoheme IX farnesyltransferase [Bacillaceae bacterium]
MAPSSTNVNGTFRDYITVTKPGITMSNILGTFAGFMLAMGSQSFTSETVWLLIWSLLGTALVISGGTTLNNVIDRDIDRHMERTRLRPVTNNRITPRTATVYGLILAVTGEVVLTFGVHPLSALLAFVGLLVYVIIYSAWLKRTTTLNTVIGGISGAMPPLVGYAAVTESVDMIALILFSFLFLWQPPHFLALAMRRVDEYRGVNVPMLPVVVGFKPTKRQILAYTLCMVPVSLFLYWYNAVGQLYLWVALSMGLIYIVLAVRGLFVDEEQDVAWATQMFKYSILYLTVMFVMMMVDAV